jgi:membrane protein
MLRPSSASPRNLIWQLRTAWSEYERDYARYYAAAIVYYALVSLVPLLLLLLVAIGLALHVSPAVSAAERTVLDLVDAGLGAEFAATLAKLLQRLRHDSILATSLGVLGLLLAASVLFKHLRMTFRALWGKAPPLASGTVGRAILSILVERAIAFSLVFAGGAVLLVTFVILAAVQWLTAFLGSLPGVGRYAAFALALPVPLVIASATFALFLKFLPPVRLRWREVWLASVLCGVAWLLGAEVLTIYGAVFGGGGAYGALGAVLVVMLWMNVVSQVLFFGAELCKVVRASARASEPAPV